MPKSIPGRAAARPTPYGDLNDVLAQLVSGARTLLGDNFVGAYLQGSFAIGDADEHSDVDITLVIDRDLTAAEIPALDALHGAIHDLPSPWAQHLEASYMPRQILRRWSTTPRDPPDEPRSESWGDPGLGGTPPRVYPYWYLNNGARTLVRSEHDNTQVVRWTLREKGVVLAGPPPRTLVDPVPAEVLRTEVRGLMETLARRLAEEPALLEARWIQAFMAVLTARMLHTLASGRVNSKRAAATFAAQTLEPRWAALVTDSWAHRQSQPRGRDAPAAFAAVKADPHAAAETLAFAQAAPGLIHATPASAAKAVLERKLALQRQGPPVGNDPARAGRGFSGAGRRGWTPPPIRPGGRGRRG